MKTLRKTSTLAIASLISAALGTSAMAQDTDVDEAAEGSLENVEESSEKPMDVVVVTGSRIRSANVESVSPVTTLRAEEFETTGTIRTEDLLNQLPQVSALQGSAASNEATGTAQVDLRGLSPDRTLVLVNGRRLPYGSPISVPSDLNQVPSSLIRSVEVLTGGASAVYGSDAIAGVVNFKLIDDFEGIKFSANLNKAQHNNGNTMLQNLNEANNYAYPDGSEWDGFGAEYSMVMGANTAGGRGNVTAYASYREVDPIVQSGRDYSSCALGATGDRGQEFSCSGSGYANPANLSNTAGIPNLATGFRVDDGRFVEGSNVFNFAPFNYYQRPDERRTLGAMGHLEVNEYARPYFEMSFMDDRSVAQIAPGTVSGGISGRRGGLNCDNPFLSDQQADFLCTAAGMSTGSNYDSDGNYLGPDDIAEGILVRRRNLEGGPRQDEIRHQTHRFVIGSTGRLFGSFEYDVYGSYSNVAYRSRFSGDANFQRLGNALNAVTDMRPSSSTYGQPVCAINADGIPGNDDPACMPLDYFGPGGASQSATQYVLENKGITGDTALTNIVFSANGDLGEYGVQLPWSDYGVGVAAGLEYRKNSLEYVPDEIYQNAGTPEMPVEGDVSVKEMFAEVNVPIINNAPLAYSLDFEAAYRYSDYSTDFTTDTYGFGLNWSPTDTVRVRTSYQRAVRAPNVIELFSSQNEFEVELTELPNGSFDPCSGANPYASMEECALTGVTPAQYGNIQDNPAGQFNTLVGGNPDLQPETADTYSLGVVYTPYFLEGLTVSADFFDISVSELVGSVNPNLAMNNCLETGDPYFCGLIQRGQGGTLFLFEDGYFERFNINTGSLDTSGVDLSADYTFDLGDKGDLGLNLVGTYVDEFESTPLPSSPDSDVYDCKGLYAGLCGRPRPEWRHKMRAGWISPFDVSVFLTWRHTSSVDIAQTSSQPALEGSYAEVNKSLSARNYFDLSASYYASDKISMVLGVNNLLDRDPPLTTAAAIEDGGNGNTYPQFYDAVGRTVFFSITYQP